MDEYFAFLKTSDPRKCNLLGSDVLGFSIFSSSMQICYLGCTYVRFNINVKKRIFMFRILNGAFPVKEKSCNFHGSKMKHQTTCKSIFIIIRQFLVAYYKILDIN